MKELTKKWEEVWPSCLDHICGLSTWTKVLIVLISAFVKSIFEPLSKECVDLLESSMVVPMVNPGDIVIFSRFTQ